MKITVIGGGPAGLYFGILMRKTDPAADITVIERNPEGVTWGWGVVFSDETLENLQQADETTYERITRTIAHWESIDVIFGGRTIRSGTMPVLGSRKSPSRRISPSSVRRLPHVSARA